MSRREKIGRTTHFSVIKTDEADYLNKKQPVIFVVQKSFMQQFGFVMHKIELKFHQEKYNRMY